MRVLATTEPNPMPRPLTAEQRRGFDLLRMRLRDAVQEYDIVQKLLADACEVTQQTVSLVLRGKLTAVEVVFRMATAVMAQPIKTVDKQAIRLEMTRLREA